MKKKDKPLCAVNGCLRAGNLRGICMYSSVGEPTRCVAHGNRKCEHKIPVGKQGGNS